MGVILLVIDCFVKATIIEAVSSVESLPFSLRFAKIHQNSEKTKNISINVALNIVKHSKYGFL